MNQASAIRALLSDVPEVIVGTANQLQGAERPAIVALHPLIGHRGVGPFAMELGRACVLLSRHSAHLTLVTDHEAIKAVVAASPTGTPGAAEHLHLLQALAELSEV
ncbi:hypothetical protein OG948_59435 (plasmid) [Embleya sp. NBC_00888]|nr:hypothetical protein OG948_59435 [Embleya sp. NBC_00888]